MAKYKIEFDREKCIGALACHPAAPKRWLLADDGKVDLRDATYNPETKKWEVIIEESELQENLDAEEVCPVYVIKVTKIED